MVDKVTVEVAAKPLLPVTLRETIDFDTLKSVVSRELGGLGEGNDRR